MIFIKSEDGTVYTKCEYCNRTLQFQEISLKRVCGKDFDQLYFPRPLECFCSSVYECIEKVPKLPYNKEVEEEDIIFDEPWRDYFGKIQRYVPLEIELSCPIRIMEAAVLKDTQKNEIMLRVKMSNLGEKEVVAVFAAIEMEDISGNPVCFSEEEPCMHYIYEDILIHKGENFGEKTAIRLPDQVRRVNVKIEKAGFLDGRVWKSKGKKTVPIQEQETIKLPADFNERFIARLKHDLDNKMQDLSLISSYYVENEQCWQCTCKRVNPMTEDTCVHCGLPRAYVKEILSKEAIEKRLEDYTQEKLELAVREEQALYEMGEKRRIKKRMLAAGGGIITMVLALWMILFFL